MSSTNIIQMTDAVKTINDPVHGQIEIHPLCMKIINTPEFQRLRGLKQCGISYLVYPSAVHTRFEHSIGVYHLAGRVLDKLKVSSPNAISEEEYLCVRIAALLHDLGHGPFSHLWEKFIKLAADEEWHHEDMSVLLFKQLITNNKLSQEFEKHNLKEGDIELIENIIRGRHNNEASGKHFLFEIVANSITNIDVDRWDYMERDAYFFGIKCPISFNRIISYMSIDQEKKRIAFRYKVQDDILETFQFRKKMHRVCYQHKVTKNIEVICFHCCRLLDALCAADKVFRDEGRALSSYHRSVEVFLSLNEWLLHSIMYSTNPKLNEAKNILLRIQRRELYDYVGSMQLTKKISLNELKSIQKKLNSSTKNGIDWRVDVIDIGMGIKCDDPFKEIIFFNKENVSKQRVFSDVESKFYDRDIKIIVFAVNKVEDMDEKNNVFKKIEEIIQEKDFC